MPGTKAIAVKAFDGAPDGDVYPQRFEKGDPVEGDLADVALAQKWAREPKNEGEFAAAVKARDERLNPKAAEPERA